MHTIFVLMHVFRLVDAITYGGAHFGQGSGPIGLDNIACSGSEKGLVNCSYDTDTTDCTHLEDVGLRCQPECKITAHIQNTMSLQPSPSWWR